jgi:hypothetical protein
MSDNLYNIKDAKVGDTFSHIAYARYGTGTLSVYDYKVIRAGKRDIVCHAFKVNGSVVLNGGDSLPTEFKFKRSDYHLEFYEIGSDKIIAKRAEMLLANRKARCWGFLTTCQSKNYDDEFIVAVEAFIKRTEVK